MTRQGPAAYDIRQARAAYAVCAADTFSAQAHTQATV